MKTTLLIMAAGLGSRYGGIKQIDHIGPHGEILLEYSIYDAMAAGFDKVVFVIKRSMADTFRELIGDKIAKKVEVEYAYQEYDSLPDGFVPPEGRTKPYGTVHAVLVAKRLDSRAVRRYQRRRLLRQGRFRDDGEKPEGNAGQDERRVDGGIPLEEHRVRERACDPRRVRARR